MSWYMHESPGLKPDCMVEMSLFSSKKAYTWSKMIFSNRMHMNSIQEMLKHHSFEQSSNELCSTNSQNTLFEQNSVRFLFKKQ